MNFVFADKTILEKKVCLLIYDINKNANWEKIYRYLELIIIFKICLKINICY